MWDEYLPATRGQLRQLRRDMNQADTNLQAAVARLAASTSAEIKAITDKLAGIGSDDPVVVQAVADLNKVADALDAETVTLTTPPAPPAAG